MLMDDSIDSSLMSRELLDSDRKVDYTSMVSLHVVLFTLLSIRWHYE